MDFLLEQPVAEAGEVSGKARFGAAVKIIALAASFTCYGADPDNSAFTLSGIGIGYNVQDRDGSCIIYADDPFAFLPVRLCQFLLSQVAEYIDGDIGQGGKGRKESF